MFLQLLQDAQLAFKYRSKAELIFQSDSIERSAI